MPGKQKQKKQKQEDQVSSVSENANDYQKDDFVVDSADDDNSQEQLDSDGEEYNSLELSEDDLQLIEENKKKKKGRLQRKADSSDEEAEYKDDSEYREGEELLKKKVKQKSISDDLEGPHLEEDMAEDEEDIPDEKKRQVLEEFFDPHQRQALGLQELDEKIIENDIPERVQLQFLNVLGQLPDELGQRESATEDQVQWVTERLLFERIIPIKPSERPVFTEGVRIVLDLFHKENVEVQFVITYKKYYITPLLGNEHIWRIQELDIQWEIFSASKTKLQQKLNDLKKNGCQVSAIVEKYLNESILEQQLSDMSEYLKYIETRQKCFEAVRNLKSGSLEQLLGQMSLNNQNRREYFLCQAFFLKIDELASKVLLKVEDFAELLAGNTYNLNHWVGKNQEMNFDKVKEWVQPDQNLVKDISSLIITLQKFVKQEMFIHPVVRHYIWLEYQRYTSVSTTPTALGLKEITALNYLYPVKRIKNRPVKYMEDESFLMLLKAEELDYIETKFRVQEVQKQEKNQYVDQIMITIQQKYKETPGMSEKSQGEREKTNRIENLRDFILRQFLLEQIYPFLELRMREHLKEQGNLSVIRHCSKEFLQIINQEPHQSSQEEQQGQKTEDENKKVMSLVLVNEENPRDNELAKTFTSSYSLEKKHIGMAIVDGKGEVLNMQIFNYLLQNKQFKPTEPRDKEMSIIQGLLAQYQPDVIVISANQTECIKLRADFRDEHLFSGKWWASLVDSSISHIYALSERSNQQLPEIPQVLREAVSLARFKLSPLAEVLNIWDEVPDQNGCLNIQMHPLQKMVPQKILQNELMKVACEVVCSVGVDPVDAALHTHLQAQVQFLAGLGSRKSRRFMQLMKAYLSNKYLENHYESERRITQAIKNSEEQYIQLEKIEILKNGLFNRNVFKNLHGFLRIENGFNPLDRTRLINSMYSDAAYMACAALDLESKDEKDYTPIFDIMRQPKALDDLELEEWALKKEKSNLVPQFIRVVQFMKNELTNPFQHHYEKSGEMSHKDIFYKATQETPYTLKKNSIVTGPIIQVKQDVICIRLSQSGLIGVLPKWEFQPERVSLQEEFSEGQIIKAYVKSIEALSDEKQSIRQRQPGAMQEEKEKNKSVNVFRLELTLKPDWNPIEQLIVVVKPENWFKAYPYRDYEDRIKKSFDLKEFKTQDCPQIQLATQPVKQQKLILRKINHPKFKQVMLKGAIEYIEGQKVGEYIIRPSSRGKEFLTITWKFFEGVLVHLLVKEEYLKDYFKPKLLLGKDEYETFDEIYERYIVPCNNHMEAVANNKKFSSEKIEVVEKRLKDEKELDTAIVPYGFCVTERAPQYLVLIYVPKDKVEKEYIKVKPEGLFFHGQVFSTLKALTSFFKEEFRKPEYKSYLKRVKPPFSDTDKIAQINQNYLQQNEIKREKGKDEKIKYEGSDYSNIYCTKCSRRGHTANDCRGADKDKFRNKNERPDSRTQRNSGTCFNCNQAGHVKKNCPQLNQQQPSSRLPSSWDRNDTNQGGWGNSQHHRNRSRSRSRDRSQEANY